MYLADKYKGALIGAIFGDCLGLPIEFMKHKEIISKYGNADNYIESLREREVLQTSDETLLLMHGVKFFSQTDRDYTDFLGDLHFDPRTLHKRGVSATMRGMIRDYSYNPDTETPYAENTGTGFLPLLLPGACVSISKTQMHEILAEYVDKTHAFADMEWVDIYFSALHALLHNESIYSAVESPQLDEIETDRQLSAALSGNIETITSVSGASKQILPAAITLYLASNNDFERMVRIAFKCFQEADFDTLFFATGALIGASVGYDALPMTSYRNVRDIEDIEIIIEDFMKDDTEEISEGDERGQLKKWVTQNLQSMRQSKDQVFELVPELRLQDGYDSLQRRHNHTLLEHTLRVVDGLPKEDTLLRIAGLLHDIAKPFTASKHGDRATYHNHAKTSARMAYQTCYRLGFSEDDAKTISQIIMEHVINYSPQWSNKAIGRFSTRNRPIQERLFQLVGADNDAQLPTHVDLDHLKSRLGVLK
jgi:putative nucleotidyltransferase with HDIG domain